MPCSSAPRRGASAASNGAGGSAAWLLGENVIHRAARVEIARNVFIGSPGQGQIYGRRHCPTCTRVALGYPYLLHASDPLLQVHGTRTTRIPRGDRQPASRGDTLLRVVHREREPAA